MRGSKGGPGGNCWRVKVQRLLATRRAEITVTAATAPKKLVLYARELNIPSRCASGGVSVEADVFSYPLSAFIFDSDD